jgi:serine/threonine-protein phosphatase PGAM5
MERDEMKKWLISLVASLSFGASCAAQSPAPATRTLVLVRHGHYSEAAAADKKLGPGLTPLGIAQARLAGARLGALPTKFDALYSSPMQRARDTAATIGGSFPGQGFEVIEDLAECTPPTRRLDATRDEKPEDLVACQAQLERVFARFFRRVQGASRQEMLVCHGNVIRYLVTRALGVDSQAWLEMTVGHASITQIRVDADGRFKVLAVGDVGHLPPNLQTASAGKTDRELVAPALSP